MDSIPNPHTHRAPDSMLEKLFVAASIHDLTSLQQNLLAEVQQGAIPSCYRGTDIFPESILWKKLINQNALVQINCFFWPKPSTGWMGVRKVYYIVDENGLAQRVELLNEMVELMEKSNNQLDCLNPDVQFELNSGKSKRLTNEKYFDQYEKFFDFDQYERSDWNVVFAKDGDIKIAFKSCGGEIPIKPFSIVETHPRSETYQRLNKQLLCEKIKRKEYFEVRHLLSTDSSLGYNVDESGNSVLHLAIISEDFELIQLVLETHSFLKNVQNNEGDTALHLLLKNRDGNAEYYKSRDQRGFLLEPTRLLISSGADLKVLNHKGVSPISQLSKLYSSSLDELLQSEKNANLLKDLVFFHSGCAHLLIYFRHKWPSIIPELVSEVLTKQAFGVGQTLFGIAVYLGDVQMAKLLLEKLKLDVNAFCHVCHNPPLLVAIGQGDAEMVKFLDESGADPTVKGFFHSIHGNDPHYPQGSAIDLVRDDSKRRKKPHHISISSSSAGFRMDDNKLILILRMLERRMSSKPLMRMKNFLGL